MSIGYEYDQHLDCLFGEGLAYRDDVGYGPAPFVGVEGTHDKNQDDNIHSTR